MHLLRIFLNLFVFWLVLALSIKNILDEVGDTLKTEPDTLIIHALTNDLTKNINTLRNVKKLCEKAKRISPDTKIVFFEYNLLERQTRYRH